MAELEEPVDGPQAAESLSRHLFISTDITFYFIFYIDLNNNSCNEFTPLRPLPTMEDKQQGVIGDNKMSTLACSSFISSVFTCLSGNTFITLCNNFV